MRKLLIKAFLGLFCVLAFLGCSRLDLAMNLADDYIASKVDDYFDLNSRQSKDLKSALHADLRKIRKEQFPKWASSLRSMAQTIHENKLNEEIFKSYFQDILVVSKSLQPAFTETAVHFISRARPEQLEHFEGAIRKKNIEDEKKIQNRQKSRDETRKKYLRGIEMWVDSLSQDQDQLLNRHLNENPFPTQALIKNRSQVLERFKEAQKSPLTLKNFVRDYYSDKTRYAAPEYQKALIHYQTELQTFCYQLFRSLSQKQKNLLYENLLEKASLLEKLAAKN